MVAERDMTDWILQVFEEQEDCFHFPVTSQKEARAFVKALHIKGLEYGTICEEIGEFEHNFESWKKGLGRPGVGNRIIEMINRPLQEILFSEDEEDDEEEEAEVTKQARKPEVKGQGQPRKETTVVQKETKVLQKDMTDSWASRVSEQMRDIEISKPGSSESDEDSEEEQKTEEEEVTEDEDDDDDEEKKEPMKDVEQTADVVAQEESEETEDSVETTSTTSTSRGSSSEPDSSSRSSAQEDKVEDKVKVKEDKGQDIPEVKVTAEPQKSPPPENGTSSDPLTATDRVDNDFISSDSSSVVGAEITENYDSDLDIEGIDPNSEDTTLIKRVASMKAQTSDGPGFVYVFTDSSSFAREHRIKIGASRFPNKRLEQAMHYNVGIRLASAVAVNTRRAALRDVLLALKGDKVQGHEDWFRAPLDRVLGTVSETTAKYAKKTSDC